MSSDGRRVILEALTRLSANAALIDVLILTPLTIHVAIQHLIELALRGFVTISPSIQLEHLRDDIQRMTGANAPDEATRRALFQTVAKTFEPDLYSVTVSLTASGAREQGL